MIDLQRAGQGGGRVSKAENQGAQCTRCLFVQYSLPWSLKGNHK